MYLSSRWWIYIIKWSISNLSKKALWLLWSSIIELFIILLVFCSSISQRGLFWVILLLLLSIYALVFIVVVNSWWQYIFSLLSCRWYDIVSNLHLLLLLFMATFKQAIISRLAYKLIPENSMIWQSLWWFYITTTIIIVWLYRRRGSHTILS